MDLILYRNIPGIPSGSVDFKVYNIDKHISTSLVVKEQLLGRLKCENEILGVLLEEESAYTR
jgi:hypothetical protein